MRTQSSSSGAVLLACLWAQAAYAVERPGQLEISIGRGRVPTAEILGWVVRIDGERVEPPPPGLGLALSPGPHTIALQVHYYRGLKTLITPMNDKRLGFTFVAAGGRWVEKEYSVNAGSASVVRVDATLADNPEAIADQLVVAHSVRAAAVGERPAPPVRIPLGPTLAERVQERAAWVTALVAPQLVRGAGASGDATVRVAVDREGYLRDFHLDATTGDPLLDHPRRRGAAARRALPAVRGVPDADAPVLGRAGAARLPALRRLPVSPVLVLHAVLAGGVGDVLALPEVRALGERLADLAAIAGDVGRVPVQARVAGAVGVRGALLGHLRLGGRDALPGAAPEAGRALAVFSEGALLRLRRAAAHARLPAAHARLPAAHARLPATHARLPATHARLPATDAGLTAAHARRASTRAARIDARAAGADPGALAVGIPAAFGQAAGSPAARAPHHRTDHQHSNRRHLSFRWKRGRERPVVPLD